MFSFFRVASGLEMKIYKWNDWTFKEDAVEPYLANALNVRDTQEGEAKRIY